MDTAQWRQVRQLFEDALALAPSERQLFLDRSCGDDPSIRREVDSMLRSHDTLGRFLEPPEEPHPGSGHQEPDHLPGTMVGPYRIEGRIGEGGMGTVYRAVRDYGQYRKPAAVKFIRRHLHSAEALARFEQEQESLARLDHPYVARLLDSGQTEAGLPYVVMEYVEGTPIDAYCNERSLGIEDRLHLFQKVCSAVRYAHEHLIVHCDLKPGNILVTEEGTPRLLDFGIARILNTDRSPAADEAASRGMRFITLEYASPERVRGENVTTASDVYSLGVLLYRLLTGRSPYRFEHRLPHEMTKAICEQEPEAPSTARRTTTPNDAAGAGGRDVGEVRHAQTNARQRALAGDLDAIVLKALRKDTRGRYSSVEQLSEDIRRHLEGLPVKARPQTFGYRASKFLGRHRAGAFATVAVLLAVVAGVAGVLWQANKARLQAEKAERISAFLEDMLSSAHPAKSGKDFTVVEALSRAAERADRELAGEPVAQATVFRTIGQSLVGLGEYDKAEVQLRKAMELRLALFGQNSLEVAECLHSQADLAQLRTRFPAADSLYRLAVGVLERQGPEGRPELARTLHDWGGMKLGEDRLDTAAIILSASVGLLRTMPDAHQSDLAIALDKLAAVHSLQGQLAAAESIYAEVLGIWRRIGDGSELDAANAMHNYAFVLLAKGDSSGAEVHLRSALEVRRGIFGADHSEYGRDLMTLGSYLIARNRLAEAEPLLLEALPLFRKAGTPELSRFAFTNYQIGYLRNRMGRFAAAEAPLREGLATRRDLSPPGDPRISTFERELGSCLAGQGRYAEAEPLFLDAWALLKSATGPDSPASQETLAKLRSLYVHWGKPDKARALPQ